MNYNLCDERWIPVLYRNGQFKEVGILQALREAGDISQIAASNPMDRVALLRFLLAIVYWCQGTPPSDEEKNKIQMNDQFSNDLLKKLSHQASYFDLFGETRRFYQDSSAQRERPITDLIHEIPTGNNFWHFAHTIDYTVGLCLSCCAKGLLRLPLFHVSGLPDLKGGINGVPPIYVIPLGNTLLETLRLNWRKYSGDLGTPAWEDPRIQPSVDIDVPLLTGLTVLSRRICLHKPFETDESCIMCGRREGKLIGACKLESAGSLENKLWNDPHVVYSSSDKAVRAPNLEDELINDRPWCHLFTELSLPDKAPQLTLFLTGFSTNKAKYVDVWERTCTIRNANPDQIQRWKESGDLLRRLKPKDWDPKEPKGRKYTAIRACITALTPHIESRVSLHIPELIVDDSEAKLREGVYEYHQAIGMLASSIYPEISVQHLSRQGQLQNAVKLAKPRKAAVKKGKNNDSHT